MADFSIPVTSRRRGEIIDHSIDVPDRIYSDTDATKIEEMLATLGQPPPPREPLKNFCSFCGKREDEVELGLVAGPVVFICNECVPLCVDFFAKKALARAALSAP